MRVKYQTMEGLGASSETDVTIQYNRINFANIIPSLPKVNIENRDARGGGNLVLDCPTVNNCNESAQKLSKYPSRK